MCGIAGVFNLSFEPVSGLKRSLEVMNELQRHRGPDGHGTWEHPKKIVGLAHRRLSIIDLSTSASQPMVSQESGNWISYNGEIYNYKELRDELGAHKFKTTSDTEVILKAYERWGQNCLEHLRGMFAFALWDEKKQELFCARDRFGIKPFYYATVGNQFYFASEIKTLLPFLKSVDTDLEGFKDYLAFQFCLDGKTLFKGVQELKPGHLLTAKKSSVETKRYWQVYYNLDWDHTAKYFEDKVRELLNQSVDLHLRSDVPVGAYVSGGLDSSIIATLAASKQGSGLKGFTGKFEQGPEYDESPYARAVAKKSGFELEEISMTADDFIKNIRKVIYHLDYPVAGPGSFPQYMVSQLASRSRKVVLGGQGGDEIFGGYARYLIAYFEQCIKSAIEGNQNQGKNFIVTYESIIPNLASLKAYKPMIQEFWKEGLFEDLDRRYFRLINRAPTLGSEINWKALDGYNPYDSFLKVFRAKNVEKESYFDSMTHFDFKTLLPALLQVEDRVSMAHGVESRVPLLDHPLVELVATVPSNVKFKDGTMKNLFRNAMGSVLPSEVLNRKDKMGFPVPLTDWAKTEAKDFIFDVFSSKKAMSRDLINNQTVLNGLSSEPKYGRKLWGLLCLELWQQEFHDKQADYRRLITKTESPADLELRRV